MVLLAVDDQPPGDVIAQALAVLMAVARVQPVAGLIKELACQRRTGGCSFGAALLRSTIGQNALNLLPNIWFDDRLMLSVIDLILVADASGIDWIAQDVIEVAAIYWGAPRDTDIGSFASP